MVTLRVFTKKLLKLSLSVLVFQQNARKNYRLSLSQKFKTDFVCYDKIIIELKAVSTLNDAHRSQLFNYLHATKMRLGLLINFCNPNGLEWERKVL